MCTTLKSLFNLANLEIELIVFHKPQMYVKLHCHLLPSNRRPWQLSYPYLWKPSFPLTTTIGAVFDTLFDTFLSKKVSKMQKRECRTWGVLISVEICVENYVGKHVKKSVELRVS